MKVTFNKEIVITGLQQAIAVMPTKTGQPYLRTLWISAENDTISFQSTDTSIEYSGTFSADVAEKGTVGVFGQIFYRLISTCKEMIEISYTDGDNSLMIRHKDGECKVPIMPLNWFQPVMPFPNEESVTISGALLSEAIDKVGYCIPTDEAFEALSNMYMNKQDEGVVHICGINGHLFSLFSFQHDDLSNYIPDQGILIKKIYLSHINKFLGKSEVRITFNDKRFFIKNNEEVLSVPLTHDSYPDYDTILSRFNTEDLSHLKINRFALTDTINRILTVDYSEKSYTDFYLSMDKQELSCSAVGENSGEVKEKIQISYNGTINRITFSTEKLLSIIEHFSSETLNFTLTSQEGPCSIEGNEDAFNKVIIMPVKTLPQDQDDQVDEVE